MKARTLAVTLCAVAVVCLGVGVTAVQADPPESWCPPGACMYGDGSDGDGIVASNEILNLIGDANFHDLTVYGTVRTHGYDLRVCGTLLVASGGKITDSSSGGTGGAGGDCGAGSDPKLHGSPTGCQDRDNTCTAGSAGESGGSPSKPCAGSGGDGGGGGGGGGGAWWDLGDVDADGGDAGRGGDGGHGGGCVYVHAFHLINEGTINADGEPGENGEDAPVPGYFNCGSEYYTWGTLPQKDLCGGGGGGGGGGCGGDGGTVEITVAEWNTDVGDVHAYGGAEGLGGDGGQPDGDPAGYLHYGVLDGGHQNGCAGGYGCGSGGHGGRGAHERYDSAQAGSDGEDGDSGQDGTCSVTLCCWPGDVDQDCDVDLDDIAALNASYHKCENDEGYNPCADFNGDDCVDLTDLSMLLGNYGCGPEPLDCE